MSGEAGGVLVGGAAALLIAPVVIAGAAALGLAYGAIKVGVSLGKHAADYAREKKREKELVVNQCSTQLESMFEQMRSVVRDAEDQHVKYANEMSRQFHAVGEELKSTQDEKPSAEELDKKIAGSRSAIQSELQKKSAAFREQMLEGSRKGLSECVRTIEKSNAEKGEIVQWADKTAAAEAMQRAAAADMLRDAEASYRVLDSMAKSGRDEAFRNQVGKVRSSLERARDQMARGMYQAAFSSARAVIRESAMLASEHVQDELEMDMLVMELQAKVEGLCEEMKNHQCFSFFDETRQKQVNVDLNRFSQGKYAEMIKSLQDILNKSGSCSSPTEVKLLTEDFDNNVEPEARRIIQRSLEIMTGYFDRLRVLDVVADFMTQQDYKMDWAMPVGGDASQKLVVHFIQKTTGNSVSVTLDHDADSENIARMAMEVLTFYENGRPVTEQEKQTLREHLNNALHEAGLSGSLGCQERKDQPSARVEMAQKEAVRKQLVNRVI